MRLTRLCLVETARLSNRCFCLEGIYKDEENYCYIESYLSNRVIGLLEMEGFDSSASVTMSIVKNSVNIWQNSVSNVIYTSGRLF